MSEDFTTFRMNMIQKDTLFKKGRKGEEKKETLCTVGENVN